MKLRLFILTLFFSSFLSELCAQTSNPNLELFLSQRKSLATSNLNYIPLELEAISAGLRIPALVTKTIQSGQQILEFKAYKIDSEEARLNYKVRIAQGTPSLQHVEITDNRVKVIFNIEADVHHVNTLFRMLGYNSYELLTE